MRVRYFSCFALPGLNVEARGLELGRLSGFTRSNVQIIFSQAAPDSFFN